MRKLFDLQRNLRALSRVLVALLLVVGMGTILSYYPQLLFSFPLPNGKSEAIFFEESPATKMGLHSGMVGYVTLPEKLTLGFGEHLQKTPLLPDAIKNLFQDQIQKATYQYYGQDFSRNQIEVRGMGSLEIVKKEKVPEGYRVAVRCDLSRPGTSEIEVTIRHQDEVLAADSFPVKCARAQDAKVTLQKAGEVERTLGSTDPALSPTLIHLNDEVEARFWLTSHGTLGDHLLSGDEGIALADDISPILVLSTGTVALPCPEKPSAKCQIPVLKFKAVATGVSPAVMVGETKLVLPLTIVP